MKHITPPPGLINLTYYALNEIQFMLPCFDVITILKVLDMCAAPGSKTAQLIEIMHSDDNVPNPGEPAGL